MSGATNEETEENAVLGRIFRKTEVLDCGDSIPTTDDAKDTVCDHTLLLPDIASGRPIHPTLSYLTEMRNRVTGANQAASTPQRKRHMNLIVQDEHDTSTTQWIVAEIKTLQLQVDSLKQDSSIAALAHAITDPFNGTGGCTPPRPKGSGGSGKRRPQQRGGNSAGEESTASANPLTAGKAIRQRIIAMRADKQLMLDFSEQCDQWALEAKRRRVMLTSTQQNYIIANTKCEALKEHTAREKRKLHAQAKSKNHTKRAVTVHNRKKLQMASYAHKSRELNRKLLRLAMLQGTLSTKQCIMLTSARMWHPVFIVWMFAQRLAGEVEHFTALRESETIVQRKEAVGCLETWWIRHKQRHALCRRTLAVRVALPWRERARQQVVTRSYSLIAQFMKDWVTSKRVVSAVKRILNRTRKIQAWFCKVILVRRARKALWLAQWQKVEEKTRAEHDSHAAKAAKRHKDTTVAGATPELAPPYKERRVSFIPKRPQVDVAAFKRQVALPAIPENLRREAIAKELIAASRRHVKRVQAWEQEASAYHTTVLGIKAKCEQLKLAGIADVNEDLLVFPPPLVAYPRIACLLSQPDLLRLIDTTAKKFATNIANKVAQEMEKGEKSEKSEKSDAVVPEGQLIPSAPARAMDSQPRRRNKPG